MKKKKPNPDKLNAEEQAYENAETVSVSAKELAKIKAAVKVVRDELKSARATIRLTDEDLQLLKRKAEQKGLGYQTLLGSIIHQYVTDQLVEIEAAKVAFKAIEKKNA